MMDQTRTADILNILVCFHTNISQTRCFKNGQMIQPNARTVQPVMANEFAEPIYIFTDHVSIDVKYYKISK